MKYKKYKYKYKNILVTTVKPAMSATSVRFQFFDEDQKIVYSQVVNTP